jgi:hypothetical protein
MQQPHHLHLKLIQKCPACDTVFDQSRITILMNAEQTVLAHLHCDNCGVNLLANVVAMPQGLVGNAILTDLQITEAISAIEDEKLTEDMFLALYQQISSKKLLTNVRQSVAMPELPDGATTR